MNSIAPSPSVVQAPRAAVVSASAHTVPASGAKGSFAALMDLLTDTTNSAADPAATQNLTDLKLPTQGKDAKTVKDTLSLKDSPKDQKREPEQNPTQTVAALPQTPTPLPVLDWALPVPIAATAKPEEMQNAQDPNPALSEAAMPTTGPTQTALVTPTPPLAGKLKLPAAKQEELLNNLQISPPPSKDSSDKMALAFGATLTEKQQNATEALTVVQAASQSPGENSLGVQQQAANLHKPDLSPAPDPKDIKSKPQPINAQPKQDPKAQESVEPEARTSRGPEPVIKAPEPVSTLAVTASVPKQVEHSAPKGVKSPEPIAHLETLESAPPRTEPARDISFRIAAGSSDAVDVKLTDRAGQIHVAVRSADAVLTKSLQTNVAELARTLERSGFHTETSVPGHAEPVRQAQQGQAFQDPSRDRRAPQQDQQPPKKRSQPSGTAFSLNALQPIQQENQ